MRNPIILLLLRRYDICNAYNRKHTRQLHLEETIFTSAKKYDYVKKSIICVPSSNKIFVIHLSNIPIFCVFA